MSPSGERDPQYPVEQETPREACANLCMELRERGAEAGEGWTFVSKNTCDHWASRLERAVRALEAEKTGAAYLSEQLHAADRREESLVAEVAGLRADGQRLHPPDCKCECYKRGFSDA